MNIFYQDKEENLESSLPFSCPHIQPFSLCVCVSMCVCVCVSVDRTGRAGRHNDGFSERHTQLTQFHTTNPPLPNTCTHKYPKHTLLLHSRNL